MCCTAVALTSGLGVCVPRAVARQAFAKELNLLVKINAAKGGQNLFSNDQRNKATRQIFEGAKPTIERLAIISGRVVEELKELAALEKWLPIKEATVLRRRVGALSDRVLALMEEPDDDALLSKTRLDAITSLLKAIDRLKIAILDLNDEVIASHDETEITAAYAVIDRRIEDLAEAYAKKLVEGQLNAGSN
jgi:hypothetical protein